MEYTPHGTPIIPDCQIICQCGRIHNIFIKTGTNRVAKPKDPDNPALIPTRKV